MHWSGLAWPTAYISLYVAGQGYSDNGLHLLFKFSTIVFIKKKKNSV